MMVHSQVVETAEMKVGMKVRWKAYKLAEKMVETKVDC